MTVLQEMSKTNNLTKSEFLLVGESAKAMAKATGQSIEDTVKEFSKFKGKPVESLIELAKRTGDVSPEVVKLAIELERQGNKTDAARLALQTLASVTKTHASRIEEDLHPITRGFNSVSRAIDKAYSSFGTWLNRKVGSGDNLQDLEQEINKREGLLDRPFQFGREDAQKRVDALKETLKLAKQAQTVESERQRTNAKGAAEEEKRLAAQERSLTKAQQKERELKALENDKPFITPEQFNERKNTIEDKFKDKGAASAAAKQANYEIGLYEKLNNAFIQTAESYQSYNNIQIAALRAFDDPEFKKMTDAQKIAFTKHIENLYYAADAKEKLTEQEKKHQQELAKSYEALEALRIKTYDPIMGETYYKQLAILDEAWLSGAITSLEEYNKRKNEIFLGSGANKANEANVKNFPSALRSIQETGKDQEFERSLLFKTDKEKTQLRIQYDYNKQVNQAISEFEKATLKARSEVSANFLDEALIRAGILYEEQIKLINKEKDHKERVSSDIFTKQLAQDEIFKQSFSQMGDSIVEFARTGEFEFGNMVENMIAELAKLELKMQMMKFYESMGGGSEKGILGTLFSAFTGVTQAKGGAWQSGVQMFAKGGVVNRTTAFGMQGGFGVMGEAGPEAIMPLKRGRDGSMGVVSSGGSSVQVVINNLSGSPVTQKEEVDSRGNRRVEVTVGEMVAGETQRNGSMMQRSIGNTFGTRPQLITR
jgi:phage-related minor tail protein